MRRRQPRARQTAELGAGLPAADSLPEPAPATEPVEPVAQESLPEPPSKATPDAIVAYWREMVLREPGSVQARRRLAAALEAKGDPAQAVEQLESARGMRPDDVGLVIDLANAQTALRRFDAAERELRRVLKTTPDIAGVHQGLGLISLRRGLYQQAEQELRRALELDPESGNAYFYRAEALNHLSRVDEAVEMLERAAQLQPDNARAYYLMGILQDKKGRPHEAAAMYRKAREVGGT
jgi:tetratricopeptide (TPR) repeat protein